MATANAKTQCFSCRKEIRTFKCEGCSKNFCRNDLTIHLQKLSEELDGIEYEHDQFRQKFNDKKDDPKKHPLMEGIDQWEQESINKIRQTAEECRQELNNYTKKFLIKIENKLNDIAKELKQVRQENEFNEIDLNQFKQKLNKLKEQLDKPSNVSITQESSTFINKISILQFDEGDETDVVHDVEPKQKRPFAEMPKRPFNMDEFKRVYSNEDTVEKALPYFWKNFDKENLSIWFCEYKYPEDLTQIFMSCNLVSGFFQRLDGLRKNAFGSMCVFGENNNNTISGVWFWRGQELAFLLSRDWQIDYESFSWKKLSPDDENTKKLVNQYFLWEGEHDGKKFSQGKIFK